MDASDIAKQLAEKFGGSVLDAFGKKEEPKPTPEPIRRPSNLPPQGKPTMHQGGDFVQAGPYQLKRKPLMPMESIHIDGKEKPRPQRGPQKLSPSDWQALAGEPVTRNQTFDDWVRQVCLLPLVKDYDPDYAAAARLYLQKKREAHGR